MCLMNDPREVRALIKQCAPNPLFYVQKVYKVHNGRLYPFYFDRTPLTVDAKGYVNSDSRAKGPSTRAGYVARGIHVYKDLCTVHRFDGDVTARGGVIVLAIAHLDDLIAANTDGRMIFKRILIDGVERAKLGNSYGVTL